MCICHRGAQQSSTTAACQLDAAPRENKSHALPASPPVTNTEMPARAASSMVADTVVAPSRPRAQTRGRSRRETLRTLVPARARRSSWGGRGEGGQRI